MEGLREMISEETNKSWDEKIQTIYEAAKMGYITLTKWEREFLDSIEKSRSKGIQLTHKQSKCLNKIHERIE